jgi:uncharacterized phage infection (PIP) family protein YhgE
MDGEQTPLSGPEQPEPNPGLPDEGPEAPSLPGLPEEAPPGPEEVTKSTITAGQEAGKSGEGQLKKMEEGLTELAAGAEKTPEAVQQVINTYNKTVSTLRFFERIESSNNPDKAKLRAAWEAIGGGTKEYVKDTIPKVSERLVGLEGAGAFGPEWGGGLGDVWYFLDKTYNGSNTPKINGALAIRRLDSKRWESFNQKLDSASQKAKTAQDAYESYLNPDKP